MSTLVAMLVSITLVGGAAGTQSYTIQGFDSIQACRNAEPEVTKQFEAAHRERRLRGRPLVITTCIEVAKSAADGQQGGQQK